MDAAVTPWTPETIEALTNGLLKLGVPAFALVAWWVFWKYNPWRKTKE